MTPEFSAAIDPVFAHVLDLLDRIGRRERVDPEREQMLIKDRLSKAENAGLAANVWKPAKFALVAWIDEVLIDASWNGSVWWNDNVLEFEFFRTHDRGTVFYTNAAEVQRSQGQRDALEVYYLCVFLGFRGLYRDPATAVGIAEHWGLPRRIEDWVEQTAMAVTARTLPKLETAGVPGPGAPPLEGSTVMFTWLLMLAISVGLVFAAVLVKSII
jgi:type VI secretion system protein ImpK